MRKVVFLPCHPNMWEGFETIYDREISDPSNQVTVIPIPTYHRGCDDSLFDAEYITEGYPSEVRICGLNDYNLEAQHPDTIYIQNVQDASNPGFTVHPHFHTGNLRNFTDDLVYIPYSCMSEIDPEYKFLDEHYPALLTPPGIQNADRIIVQSENMKKVYLALLAGRNTALAEYWDERISFEDYPRIRILNKYTKETIPYPDAWNRHLFDRGGLRKKTALYVTSVTGILEFCRSDLRRAREVFEKHLEQKETTALIWRPHRNLPEIIMKLRPELFDDFRALLEFYIYNDVGIFDETPTPTPAILLSDGYLGDECGIKELFKSTGKPVLSDIYDLSSREK